MCISILFNFYFNNLLSFYSNSNSIFLLFYRTYVQTLSLGQYSEAFVDAAIDGEFLYDINDDDLKNTLGIEHRLHRKKILNCVHRLKLAEAQRDTRLNMMLTESGSMDPPVRKINKIITIFKIEFLCFVFFICTFSTVVKYSNSLFLIFSFQCCISTSCFHF